MHIIHPRCIIIEVEPKQPLSTSSARSTSFPFNIDQPQQQHHHQQQQQLKAEVTKSSKKPPNDNDDNKYNNDNAGTGNEHNPKFKKIPNVDSSVSKIAGSKNTSGLSQENDDNGGGKNDTIEIDDKNKDKDTDRAQALSHKSSTSYVYKKKRRKTSSEPVPDSIADDNDQLHLYTTPQTSNVSEMMSSQQKK